MGKTKRIKGLKVIAAADSFGLPVATSATSATLHETTLVELALKAGFVEGKPQSLVGGPWISSWYSAFRKSLTTLGKRLFTLMLRVASEKLTAAGNGGIRNLLLFPRNMGVKGG